MPPDLIRLDALIDELKPYHATLVAVSKTRSATEVDEVFNHGQLDFGENYVRELIDKANSLPGSIRWHFIGHLQSNKVKLVVPVAHLIHGVDSFKLLEEIGKQAGKIGKVQDVLLQVHIALEETKFGFDETALMESAIRLENEPMPGIRVRGLMGMASFTADTTQVRAEFKSLRRMFDKLHEPSKMGTGFDTLSMGMTADYRIALEEGSTMVRIGTAVFGER